VADEDLLVILSAPENHRGHDRSSDAAADIAHEIDHAGYAVSFLRRNSDITGCRDGNEQESDSYYLGDTQPHRKTEADVQINLVRAIEKSNGETQPSCHDQPSGLNF